MKIRFGARAATLLGATALGVGVLTSAVATADPVPTPPGVEFILLGTYPTPEQCEAAATAYAPLHGPMHICQNDGMGHVYLWMHRV
ncbi:hypothetical protein OG552_19140 [Streptomyces sp. NBC_01476]|uniref:hypothetical protein n=1 Tax=Streptomyces sp. NBC_01476 TaxID=2903881 RepID=UPI002E33BE67|nr:hypothetical protein [Streptomyces sp. NBC_01476]